MMVFKERLANATKIGGPGVIVEVDEVKLESRKFNRGHRVEGAWVVNGIERTAQRRKFSVHVLSRDKQSLRRVIGENVEKGSIVFTDGWGGYFGISDACQVEHRTVNHSKHFKDPQTGTCTNTVEGMNRAFKSSVSPRHRTDESAPLMSALYIWRDKNKNRLCDAFIDLLRENLESNK